MTQKLPKYLKGPFCVSFYDKREGIIYLKKENGDIVSTRTYPSFFLIKENRNKFPDDEFTKDIIQWIDEGKHWRALLDPSIKRERVNEMIHICRDEDVDILEADVSPVRRWFSDTGALVSQKFRSLFFDLETHPLQIGFDDAAKKRHRLISWAAYDQEGNSWFEAAPKSSDANEEVLIRKLLIIARDYDVLLAWNGDNYDFFVLKERCKYHNIHVDWRQWNLLDYMQVVKKLLMSIADPDLKRSFALDAVGENVLNIRKIKLPVGGGKMHTLLEDRAHLLEEYNRRDVEIMLGVEKKREFLLLHYALCAICRTFPHRGSTFPNELADGMLLRTAIQEDKHFPSRVFKEVNENYKKYEGAFVLDPIVGFHTNIQVPDFASLYPSIILSWNMSNETMLYDGIQYPSEVMSDHAVATATGIRFRTDFEGMIPKALRILITKRGEYKKRNKELPVESIEYKNVNRLSTAVKVVTNSFYGLLGNEGSRYHNREIARSVTLTGQLLIRKMMKYFDRKGFTSVAGDSITGDRTVVLKDPEGRIIIDKIENVWPGVAHTVDGKEYGELRNWKALSARSTWQSITSIVRHKTTKDLWTIRNKHGHTTVTENHSFVIANRSVSPHEVVGRNYFETIDAPQEPCPDIYDLYNELHDKQFSYPYKNRTVTRYFDKSQGGHILVKGWETPSQIFIRKFIPGSHKFRCLLRALAAYIAEGSALLIHCTTETRTLFSISQNDYKWLADIRDDILEIIPRAHINQPRWSDSSTYHIRAGAEITYFFAALCGYKSKGKKLPSFIYTLSDEDWNVFWIKLNEGDGYIENGQYSYTSISPALVAGLSFCLSQRSIRHSIHYREDKCAWKIRTLSNRFKSRPTTMFHSIRQAKNEWVYDLSVENTQSFVDGIGRVHLHNTDSIFVKSSIDDMKFMLRDINDNFIPNMLTKFGCCTNAISMDFDKGFRTLLIVTKKRYAGRLSLFKGRDAPDDMKPEIKGLEIRRSDWAKYTQNLQMKYLMLILEVDVDPSDIDNALREDGRIFFTKELSREELVVNKGLSKRPSEYNPKPPHVRVAQWLIDEGREFFVGMKIPYIVMDHKPNIKAIHADEYTGTCDRHYYWKKQILPSILRLVNARFPNYMFSDFKEPRQEQFDFSSGARQTHKKTKHVNKKKKIMKQIKATKKVLKKIQKIKDVKVETVTLTIPNTVNEGVVKGIAKLCYAFPGRYKLQIVVNHHLHAKVSITTEQFVSMDCLREISSTFPQVIIVPKPI